MMEEEHAKQHITIGMYTYSTIMYAQFVRVCMVCILCVHVHSIGVDLKAHSNF